MKPSRLLLAAALFLCACNPKDRATSPEGCQECAAKMTAAAAQPAAQAPAASAGAAPSVPTPMPAEVPLPGPTPPPAPPPPPAFRKVEVPAHAPTLGPVDAPVTVVLFNSYQCLPCKEATATLRKLTELFPGKVRVAVRMAPFPGNTVAQLSAEAALAAHEQGRFWELDARLAAAGTKELSAADIERMAQEAGLNAGRIKAALADRRLRATVEKDAAQLGAVGLPAYFVNGRTLLGTQLVAVLQSAVTQELERAAALTAAGVPASELSEKLQQQNLESPPSVARPPMDTPLPLPTRPDAEALVRLHAPGVPSVGERSAPVTLVIFSNFASPYARNVAATLQTVQAEYGQQVRLVHRFLLIPGDEGGLTAARAALAAHQQGRFWDMHDRIFAGRALDRDTLLGHARTLKLAEDRFRADMDSDKVSAALQADQVEAAALGVIATPTVFVNDHPLLGDQAVDAYKALIDMKLPPGEKR